ncbi:MAG: ATP-binding cassette domain-containing protein [Propionicimonas sp.]|uniref:ABC-F family ATP-binding cassette domain-containing protein n=1 Tax=Propionicimonas sp. TaxID=1955623 RepID=UPI002B1FBA2C|nr:ATP-binding cassette domain-containing protein [Propionicimonas sp.]MEA4943486.1 ATP-binding cassette domain-containing protein [Propionicimonas sp.]
MPHLDINGVSYTLPDGRPLLNDISFRVGDGARVALIGPNGTGKTTLLRIISGELPAEQGSVSASGRLAVMSQFIGKLRDTRTVRDLLASVAPERVRTAVRALDAAELAMMEIDDEATQLAYAQALADFGDADGYEYESTVWDTVTTSALGVPFRRAQYREVNTLSGGEQKRLVLEALLAGPEEVLALDEPDNYLDVPAKLWLERRLVESGKTVLLISHDRELLSSVPTAIVTLEPGPAGATAWTHPGTYRSWGEAREARNARLEELRRRWDEEHAKLKALVLMYKQKAAYNADLASRYQAAQTRLAKFEQAGPPELVVTQHQVRMRLRGGQTARRAVVCEQLELRIPPDHPGSAPGDPGPHNPAGDPLAPADPSALGSAGAPHRDAVHRHPSLPTTDVLMAPFDLTVWFGERVAVLGSNGSGKSHFLRLLAAGGSRPDAEHEPVGDVAAEPVVHTGLAKLGSRVRPGWFAQTHQHPQLAGRTLLEILHRGDAHRPGMGREEASRALDRYGLVYAAEQTYDTLSGGQQARLQILLLELSGATLLLLDEPTDNLDLHSAEALEEAIAGFEGTVIAVTHDRWFARWFDRFLVFGTDGRVTEHDEPVWDEPRVRSSR